MMALFLELTERPGAYNFVGVRKTALRVWHSQYGSRSALLSAERPYIPLGLSMSKCFKSDILFYLGSII